jgi:hypothetical protein
LVVPAGVPEIELSAPQAPAVAGSAVAVRVSRSPETGDPVSPLVTVTVIAEVLVAVAGTFFGDATTTTLFATAVCVIVAAALVIPPLASVTVTPQGPAVSDAVYVVVALPLLSVVPKALLSVPHAAAPLVANLTGSFALAGPPIVAVTVDVVLPSAGTLVGFAATLAVFAGPAGDFWVTTADPVPLVADSVALIVQNPIVDEEV